MDQVQDSPQTSGKGRSQVDYSQLPRIPITTNRPTLKELFVLGWEYFLPDLPEWKPRARRRKK